MEHSKEQKSKEEQAVNSAFASTQAVASIGIATIQMLETLLPAAAEEVERESSDATRHFMTISSYLSQQEAPLPDHVKDAMSGIMIAMQFQDRNTQVIENVTSILERYRSMLEDIYNNIDSMDNVSSQDMQHITNNVEHILSGIRMSDIRDRYVAALKKAKMHTHVNTQVTPESYDNDDIELF